MEYWGTARGSRIRREVGRRAPLKRKVQMRVARQEQTTTAAPFLPRPRRLSWPYSELP
jgi:hypothetical protein